MKELSIEEKAKAYDKAIKRANSLLSSNELGNAWIYKLLPELKESEDEKNRKEIIDFLQETTDNIGESPNIWTMNNAKKWIAWLEKQGEHANFRNKIQIGDQVTRNQDGMLVNLSQLKRVAKPSEKLGKQKPAENKGMNLVEEEMTPFQKKVFCIIDTTIEEEQGLKQVCDELLALASNEIKQNSTWSEEDETTRNNIRHIIRQYDKISKKNNQPCWYIGDCLLWMQNIKGRV